jgi:hypothetical protein
MSDDDEMTICIIKWIANWDQTAFPIVVIATSSLISYYE